MKRDALFNMIEQQIRPWDVLDVGVLAALKALPRAGFVPPSHRAFAYMDTDLPLVIDGEHTGVVMPAPRVLARLVQSLAAQPHESLAQIGVQDGYMTALLARFARLVTVYETDERVLKFAQNNLNQHHVRNVNYELGSGLQHSTDKFDALILAGSVSELSDALRHKVNVGGRIVAIVGQPDAVWMRATLTERVAEHEWRSTVLFETHAQPLPNTATRHFEF
ncbi:MAG: protein-L-isoaspartate O-methyltransferase family protein [Formosimonas sp.]